MVTLATIPQEITAFAVIIQDRDGSLIEIPPVLLLAPLATLDLSFRQKKTTQVTRGGHVEFHWGDELDTIDAKGVSLAFMQDGAAGGLTSARREGTEGYEDFRALLDLYKNNGTIQDNVGRVISAGRIIFIHDIGRYSGLFESFTYSESDTDPFRLQINFTFKVEATSIVFAPTVAGRLPGSRPTDVNFLPPSNVKSFKDLGQFIQEKSSPLLSSLREAKQVNVFKSKPKPTQAQQSSLGTARILR